LTLIREKTALLFWEFADSRPVRLLEVILQLEITANSTYWKANLRLDRPYLPIWEKNPCFDHFPLYHFYDLYQGNQGISLPENFPVNGNSLQLLEVQRFSKGTLNYVKKNADSFHFGKHLDFSL